MTERADYTARTISPETDDAFYGPIMPYWVMATNTDGED